MPGSLVYPGIIKNLMSSNPTRRHITCELGAGIMSRAESPCINPYKVLLKLDMLSWANVVTPRRQPKHQQKQEGLFRC